MAKKYFGLLFTVGIVLLIILISIQPAFAMQIQNWQIIRLSCTDFEHSTYNLIADVDNTGGGAEAYEVTVRDGQGTLLFLLPDPPAAIPLGTYNNVPGATYTYNSNTPLDNVRVFTWVSLAGGPQTDPVTVFTQTNPDCTVTAVPTVSFTSSANFLAVDFTDTSTQNPTSWDWDFGDSSSSTAQNPSHTYASAGTYNVCLTASNHLGAGTQSCQDVTVSAAPQAPTSSFTYSANFLAVDFTDTSTQNPTSWDWDFGDSNTSTAQNPSHTYASAGTYNVCLTASNGVGAGTQSCQDVTVSAAPQAPTSSFTFTTTNLTADFTDTSTQSPTSWDWDFGDSNTSTAQNPSHTYASAGTYNVCLTASNGVGAGTQSCQDVTVSAAPQAPTSSFTFTTTDLTADFTDTSTQSPTSWDWDFGDSNTSTAQNPSHTYAADGTYTVCLTASNGVGAGTQSCQDVTVADGQSSGGGSQNPNKPNNDRDGDGIPNSIDNCPDAYNPGQEDGWGSALGDACDTDWYNMRGIGISGFMQKSGIYHLHGNCQFLTDGAPRCPEIAIFNPAGFTPGDMPMEVTTEFAGAWSVWIFYLHSNNGVDVYQVNVYTTNPPQPDSLIDDRLEIHVRGGSWRWYQRGGNRNYNGN